MKFKYLKQEIDSFLIENNYLVHASSVQNIHVLKPSACGNLFATEDLGYAIHHVLKKKFGSVKLTGD